MTDHGVGRGLVISAGVGLVGLAVSRAGLVDVNLGGGTAIAGAIACSVLILGIANGWAGQALGSACCRRARNNAADGAGSQAPQTTMLPWYDADTPWKYIADDQVEWFQEKLRTLHDRPGDARTSLAALRSALGEGAQKNLRVHEPLDDVFLTRLLLASDFNLERSLALAKKRREWRWQLRGFVPPPDAWVKSGVVMMPFRDRFGRIVVFIRARLFDSKVVTSSMFKTGYRNVMDTVMASSMAERQSSRISESNFLEQYLLCVEVEGSGWRNFSMSVMETMVRESNDHYPDVLAQVAVLGANALARTIWNSVARMLHPRTRNKVKLVAPSEVTKFMQDLVALEDLPPQFGGHAKPWVDPSATLDLEELAGKVATDCWRRLGVKPQLGPSRVFVEPHAIFDDGQAFRIWFPKQSPGAGKAEKRVHTLTECSALVNRLTGDQAAADADTANADGDEEQSSSAKPDEQPDAGRSSCWYGCGCWPSDNNSGRRYERYQLLASTRSPQGLERWLNRMLESPETRQAILDFVQKGGTPFENGNRNSR